MRQTKFTFVDLFAGIGGFHHALQDMGGECVLASDIDEDCRRVYARSFPDTPLIGDIREVTGTDFPDSVIEAGVPDHDVLCGGFPCQAFSKSGAQNGVLDTRGTLFHDIVRIAEVKRPPFIILENVRNLVGPRHRDTWHTIVTSLRRLGYNVADEPVVLSPHNLPPVVGGTPQVRDRVFILASLHPLPEPLSPLVSSRPFSDWNPNSWRIEDWLDDDDSIPNIEAYRLRQHEIAWLDAWQAFVQGIPDDTLPGFPIWVDHFTHAPTIDGDCPKWKADFLRKNSEFYSQHKEFIDEWLTKSWLPDERYTVRDFPPSRRKFEWQARSAQPSRATRDLWALTAHFRPSGIRVKPATYLPALVAITQTSIVASRRRRITPKEAGRLQGLPDGHFAGVEDKVAYRQAGNGVNAGVVRIVAQALFDATGVWGRGTPSIPRDEDGSAA